MDFDDYKIFIFYPDYPIINSYYFFLNFFKKDLKQIVNYYSNLLSWNKWKNDKLLLILIIIFYIFLLLINKFHLFLLFKVIFYITKYILKYIFIFIDFFFYSILYRLYLALTKYNIKNIYIILKIFKIIYSLTFKLFYWFYYLIFNILPLIIHHEDLYYFYINIKNKIIDWIHLILDFLEWLPTSPLRNLPKFFKNFLKNLQWLKIVIISIYKSKYIIFNNFKNTLFLKYSYYYKYMNYYIRLFIINIKYTIYIFIILFPNQIYIINLLGILNIMSIYFNILLTKLFNSYIYTLNILFKLQAYYYYLKKLIIIFFCFK
jgi:hypothetical protein